MTALQVNTGADAARFESKVHRSDARFFRWTFYVGRVRATQRRYRQLFPLSIFYAIKERVRFHVVGTYTLHVSLEFKRDILAFGKAFD